MDKLDTESSAAADRNDEAVASSSSNEISTKSTSMWSRSLRVVPKFTVDEAEKLIKLKSKTSTVSKEYKFFTEGYINRAETVGTDAENKCHIRARC